MERICNLYIDNTHLSVTLFEYMKKEISEGTKVIVVSQDNIKKSIKSIKKTFSEKNICSKVNYLDSINEEIIKKMDNLSIILQGNEEFVLKMEEDFKTKFTNEKINANIISCYNISEKINMENVVSNYDKMLNTNGIIDISKENEKEKCDV